jgi:RAT1-interacting protein
VKKSGDILTLGCGNSKMSEDMYLRGYENIVNTDYSSVIIDLMSERCKQYSNMKWLCMDINDMKFDGNSFDCVLEKGTLDALLVDDKDPRNLSEENTIRMDSFSLVSA